MVYIRAIGTTGARSDRVRFRTGYVNTGGAIVFFYA